jgi:hypothetical protein
MDGEILRTSVLAVEKYIDGEGVEQKRNLMFYLAHRGKHVQNLMASCSQ